MLIDDIKKYLHNKIKKFLNTNDESNLVNKLKNDREKIIFNLNKMISAKKILIIGDKDVDGITSTIMLKTIINNLKGNREVHTYIPSRYDGYSITFDIAKELIDSEEYDLIINLDNGSSNDYINGILENNMDNNFLIIDHHPTNLEKIPNFVINPNLSGNVSTSTGLLVGYIFDVIKNFENKKNIKIFNKNLPNDFFDELRLLSALADMVSKNSLYNRFEIMKGLKKIEKTNRFLFKNIINDSENNDYITYINFKLIPLINTLGRLGTTNDINSFDFETLFFEENDKKLFYREYDKLLELNTFRKELTNHFYKIALDELNNKNFLPSVFVFYNENMPIGLNGIIAQKIYQTKGIPTISISPHPAIPQKLYGSARGENIKTIFNEFIIKNSLKINYGGHLDAFGLNNINIEYLEKLKQIEHFEINIKKSQKILNIDNPITIKDYKDILEYLLFLSNNIPFDLDEKILIKINDIKLIKKYNDLFALVEIDNIKGFINPDLVNYIILNPDNLFTLSLNNYNPEKINFNFNIFNKNYYNNNKITINKTKNKKKV